MTNSTQTTIPQHPAVNADGAATINQRIRFRGGQRGVVLHRRDPELIGYPIPLATGQFMLVEKFGRHTYHEDAPPLYIALGRQVDRTQAKAAYAEHGPSQVARRKAAIWAARESDGIYDFSCPDMTLLGQDLSAGGYGDRYYVAADGRTCMVRTQYDMPHVGWWLSMDETALRALI